MMRLWLKALLAVSLTMNLAVLGVFLLRAPHSGEEIDDTACIIPDIKLSEEERARAQAARGDFPRFREAHRAHMAEMRERLAVVLDVDVPDPEAVGALLAGMAEAQGVYQKELVERIVAVRATLSAEQRTKFDAVLLPRIRRGGALRCY